MAQQAAGRRSGLGQRLRARSRLVWQRVCSSTAPAAGIATAPLRFLLCEADIVLHAVVPALPVSPQSHFRIPAAAHQCLFLIVLCGVLWASLRILRFPISSPRPAPADARVTGIGVLAFASFEELLRFSDVHVETDHRNLTFMRDSTNPRVRRWCSFLSGFDFSIAYIPGVDNVIADALSRVDPPPAKVVSVLAAHAVLPTAVSNASDAELLARVYHAQQHAPAEMIASWEASDLFSLQPRGGLLLWHMQDSLWIPDTAEANPLRDMLLALAHDHSGHGAVRRTLARLADARVTWRDIRASVEHFVLTCTSCQMGKAPAHLLRHGYLHPIPASAPGQLAVADYLGPFTPVNGVTHVLVVMDKFTRYAELIPTATPSGAVTVTALRDSYFYRHDFPLRLRTDQGSHFKNAEVASFLSSCGVAHDLSPPLRPQSQGVVERLNSVIVQELKVLCGANHAAWLHFLPAVQWHINTALNVSIGMSPYEARHGTRPRGIIASVLDTPVVSLGSPAELAATIAAVHSRVRFLQDIAFERYKAHHDASSKPVGFAVGQRVSVLLSNSQRSTKLAWSHVGPFEVIAKVHDNVYTVRDLRPGCSPATMISDEHVSRLRPLNTSRVGDSAAAAALVPLSYTIAAHRMVDVSGSPSLQLSVVFPGLPPQWLPAIRVRPTSTLTTYLQMHGLAPPSRLRARRHSGTTASASPSALGSSSSVRSATPRLPARPTTPAGVVKRRQPTA